MKIIIIGGGQVGGYISNLLLENGNSVVVIENKEKALQSLAEERTEKRIHSCRRRNRRFSIWRKREFEAVMLWFVRQGMMRQI